MKLAAAVALSLAIACSIPARAAEPIAFTKWTEPKEHSFSVDVPQGWRITGGLHWNGPLDPRGYVRAQSPDGKLQVFIDDPDVLPRQVPHPTTDRLGYVEGRTIIAPAGGLILIQHFLSGSQYAQQHAAWRLCKQPRWVKAGELPALTQSIAASIRPYVPPGATARTSAGETSFTCGGVQGYVFATTVLGSGANGPIQIWDVYKLSGFTSADPMRTMTARYVMDRMMATWLTDRSWEMAVQRRAKDVTGQVMGMQNAIAAQVLRHAQQNSSTDLARLNHPNRGVNVRPGERKSNSTNSILGTKEVCDAIGRCQSVSTDYDTYFMDHSGNVRPGSSSGAPPDNSGVWSPTYPQ